MDNSPRSGECAVYGQNHEDGDCKMCHKSATCVYFNRPSYGKLKAENEALKARDEVQIEGERKDRLYQAELRDKIAVLKEEGVRLSEALSKIANKKTDCDAKYYEDSCHWIATKALNHKEG